jgi:hypothetical protein
MCIGPRIVVITEEKNQLDATYGFIVPPIGSTCFGHCYALHQNLKTIVLITTLAVPLLDCCWLEVSCRQAGKVCCLLQHAPRTLVQTACT